jgi:beta-xylosidase
MKRAFHDLGVLFDDDGTAYVVYGYANLHIAELTPDLTDAVPETEHELFTRDQGMGEGSHFYKINGKYYILSAWYNGVMRMVGARASKLTGPWEVNRLFRLRGSATLALGWHGRPRTFAVARVPGVG